MSPEQLATPVCKAITQMMREAQRSGASTMTVLGAIEIIAWFLNEGITEQAGEPDPHQPVRQ